MPWRRERFRPLCSPIPDVFVAQKKGFYTLVIVTLALSKAQAVATTRRFIRESPDIVRRYVKSQIEAVHRIKTDREAGNKGASEIPRLAGQGDPGKDL